MRYAGPIRAKDALHARLPASKLAWHCAYVVRPAHVALDLDDMFLCDAMLSTWQSFASHKLPWHRPAY